MNKSLLTFNCFAGLVIFAGIVFLYTSFGYSLPSRAVEGDTAALDSFLRSLWQDPSVTLLTVNMLVGIVFLAAVYVGAWSKRGFDLPAEAGVGLVALVYGIALAAKMGTSAHGLVESALTFAPLVVAVLVGASFLRPPKQLRASVKGLVVNEPSTLK